MFVDSSISASDEAGERSSAGEEPASGELDATTDGIESLEYGGCGGYAIAI